MTEMTARSVVLNGPLDDEDRANARLMVAAPDLAKALRALTDWAREHTGPRDANSPHELLVNAVAALAKMEA